MPTAPSHRPSPEQPPQPWYSRSLEYTSRAQDLFPGGITRVTIERDPHPVYLQSGRGAYVTDVDGRCLLDLNNNFTTLIHGHGFAPVTEAVLRQLRDGSCFANPTPHEIALAELLIDRIPAVEQIRFVNTGTEAVMFAIKAARAFTGRPAIARFNGAYHGAYDWAEAGQNGTTAAAGRAAMPARLGYAGAPPTIADDVIVLDFNDLETARERLAAHSDRLAAVLVDPMPSRAGLIEPQPGFLKQLSELARQHGILIIADEVLNLRQGFHGASHRYGLEPDLVTAGKIIGGGFPIGAVGGRRDVMAVFGGFQSPPKVAQGGTFSANPISMVAGLAAMNAMQRDDFERVEIMGNALRQRLSQTAASHAAAFSVTGAASLFRIHAKAFAPATYAEVIENDAERQASCDLVRHFRKHGILLPLGAAACLSTPMGDTEIDLIVSAFDAFLSTYEFQQEDVCQ